MNRCASSCWPDMRLVCARSLRLSGAVEEGRRGMLARKVPTAVPLRDAVEKERAVRGEMGPLREVVSGACCCTCALLANSSDGGTRGMLGGRLGFSIALPTGVALVGSCGGERLELLGL